MTSSPHPLSHTPTFKYTPYNLTEIRDEEFQPIYEEVTEKKEKQKEKSTLCSPNTKKTEYVTPFPGDLTRSFGSLMTYN